MLLLNTESLHSVDESREDGLVLVHIRESGLGRSEAEALSHIIADLKLRLTALIIKHELDMALNPNKYACETAPNT